MGPEYDFESIHKPTAAIVLRLVEEKLKARSPVDAKEIITKLSQPFDKRLIKQRKIGGRQVDYVGGEAYIARLNQAAPQWSFRVTKDELRMLTVMRWDDAARKKVPTEVPCQVVHGELEIPGVGTRAGIGVQLLEDGAGEDVVKGALTDAFKNCCKYFMLGLHMYSDTPLPYEDAPETRQDAPQATEAPAEVVDYSEDKQWQAASRTLHATAKNVIGGDDPHEVLHLMATKAGFPSITNMPVKRLLKLNEYIQSDQFDDYYTKHLRPELPQPQQGELS